MAKDNTNNNNNFALLSLVAIVAVVGVISLVMMTNTSGSAQMDSQTQMGENLAGEATVVGTSYETIVRKQRWCKCVVEDYYLGGGDLVDTFAPPCNEGSECTIETSNGPVTGVSESATAVVAIKEEVSR